MIVLDASVALELLLRRASPQLTDRLLHGSESLHAPHVLDLEIAQVLRRYSASGQLNDARGRQVIQDLTEMPLTRYPHDALLPRIWQLRDRVSAYDAAYVALAETLQARLVTSDARLARARGHRATIEVV